MEPKTPNVGHAKAFLKLLDPDSDKFCFRTFNDKKANASVNLAANWNAELSSVLVQLKQRNDSGAGVFVVVNAGGQKADEISRVRAVFADTDGAPLEQIVEALKPSFVVNTSPGKWHVYWRVTPDFPREQFASVQKAIADKFGTDRKVTDLPRVMRVPGFEHNKAEPYPVTISKFDRSLASYSLEEVVSGLGLAMGMPASSMQVSQRSLALTNTLAQSNNIDLGEVENMLRYVNPWPERLEWMQVCFALADEYGEPARSLFVRWSRGDLWNGGGNAAG